MVSVIIPMYNTENFIRGCIDSVLNANYKNLEIIIINDGSTDNGLDICKKCYGNNKRVRIYDFDNQGVSAARNKGIRVSRGDWFVFVDSDDRIEPNFFDSFNEQDNSVDMIIMDVFFEKKGLKEKILNSYNFDLKNIHEIIKKTIQGEQLVRGENTTLRGPVAKLYKKDIIARHNISFTNEVFMGEDELFNIEYFMHCEHITYNPIPVYQIKARDDSITHAIDDRIVDNNASFNKMLKKILQENNIYKEFEEIYNRNVLVGILFVMRNCIFDKKNQFKYSEKVRMLDRLRNNELNQIALKEYIVHENIKRKVVLWCLKKRFYFIINLMFLI